MPINQQSDDTATKHRRSGDIGFDPEPSGGFSADADDSLDAWVSELEMPPATRAALGIADEPIEVWLSEGAMDAQLAATPSHASPLVAAAPLIIATGVRLPDAPHRRRWMALAVALAFAAVAVAAMLSVAATVSPVIPVPPDAGVRAEPATIALPSPPATAAVEMTANDVKPASLPSSSAVNLQTAGPSESRLRVTTVPSAARVTVDGIGWGQTPLTIEHLPLGKRTVRVTREGFTSRQFQVDLRPDRPEATLHVELIQETEP